MTLHDKFMDATNGNTDLTFAEKCALMNLFINYADTVKNGLAEDEQTAARMKAYGGIELLQHMGAISDDEDLYMLLNEIEAGGQE